MLAHVVIGFVAAVVAGSLLWAGTLFGEAIVGEFRRFDDDEN